MLEMGGSANRAAKRRIYAAKGLAAARLSIHTLRMMMKKASLPLAALVLLASAALLKSATPPPVSGPEYTSDAQLKLPENYRQWVYLTTGFDMSYNPSAMAMDHHMFDNVFVNPESYKALYGDRNMARQDMLVLEVRKAEGKGSINQRGNFQGRELMGLEVHVKDEARFPGNWAFFGFDDDEDRQDGPHNGRLL